MPVLMPAGSAREQNAHACQEESSANHSQELMNKYPAPLPSGCG